jgi:hypothetical protein
MLNERFGANDKVLVRVMTREQKFGLPLLWRENCLPRRMTGRVRLMRKELSVQVSDPTILTGEPQR